MFAVSTTNISFGMMSFPHHSLTSGIDCYGKKQADSVNNMPHITEKMPNPLFVATLLLCVLFHLHAKRLPVLIWLHPQYSSLLFRLSSLLPASDLSVTLLMYSLFLQTISVWPLSFFTCTTSNTNCSSDVLTPDPVHPGHC